MIVYFHGYGASQESKKSQIMRSIIKKEYLLMPHYDELKPIELFHTIKDLHQKHGELIFVGSSAGGYYARTLAQKFASKALLINPVLDPRVAVHRINSVVPQAFFDDLNQYDRLVETAMLDENFEVGLGKRDELLSYSASLDFFKNSRCLLYEDDHCFIQSFSDFLKKSRILEDKHFI